MPPDKKLGVALEKLRLWSASSTKANLSRVGRGGCVICGAKHSSNHGRCAIHDRGKGHENATHAPLTPSQGKCGLPERALYKGEIAKRKPLSSPDVDVTGDTQADDGRNSGYCYIVSIDRADPTLGRSGVTCWL